MIKIKIYFINCFLVLFILLLPSCHLFKDHVKRENRSLVGFKPVSYLKTEIIEENLEDLLRIHVMLLNESIVALLNDEKENLIAVKTNFKVNTQQIGSFFAKAYHSMLACRLEELFSQQICLHFKYLYALKTYDREAAHSLALERRQQGNLLIEFLALNLPHFSTTGETPVMEEHLLLTMELSLAYFRQEMDEVDRLYPRLIEQMEEFSHHLIKAIQKQMEED